MKRWERATRNRRCGCCGEPIHHGDPVLVLTIQAVVKVRCVSCDGPAPADLPALRPHGIPATTRDPGDDAA
jgi:hypothetical protein